MTAATSFQRMKEDVMKLSVQHLLLACLLAVAPARGQEKLEIKESTEYFPLKQGNTWTYDVQGKEYVTKVTGFEKVGEEVGARLETRRGSDLVASEVVTVRKADEDASKEGGVFRLEFAGKKVDPALLFLKLPVKKDDTWKFDSKVGDEKSKGAFTLTEEKGLKVGDTNYDTIKVTSKDMTIPVPGSTTQTQPVSITYYFAEKVGPVKQVVEIGGVTVTAELKKFEEGK
jgi:hypothetical protein